MRRSRVVILCAVLGCTGPTPDVEVARPPQAPATTASADAPPSPALEAAQPAFVWKAPPPPDALLAEVPSASSERLGQILEALAEHHGGAALVAALGRLSAANPPEMRWFWQQRVFDAIDRCADPRAGDALAAFADAAVPVAAAAKASPEDPALQAERSLRMYGRTRAGFALAELGDLRALPLLVERLQLDQRALHAPERFWEADAGGHLSRTDVLRVASARLLSELFDAHRGAPSSTWSDAERAVLAWTDGAPSPHANAMRFLSRVRSERGLRALRKWAFPKDPLPKVGAQPPFPRAFEIAQSALRYLGAADKGSAPKLIAELKRKPAGFDGSLEGLVSGGAAMRGMVLRAIGVGASAGLGAAREVSAVDPLWQLALDPLTHQDVRWGACDALGSIAEATSLRVLFNEAVARSGGHMPDDGFVAECALRTLALAAHPGLAPDLIGVIEGGATGSLAKGAALALSATELGDSDQRRLITLLGNKSAAPDVFSAVLWATQADPKVLADHWAKVPSAGRAAFDGSVVDIASLVGEGARAPEQLARWAVRARAYEALTRSSRATESVKNGLQQIGPLGRTWTKPGLRRALLALARRGELGAVQALSIAGERGPLLALAAGAKDIPVAITEAARSELARLASATPAP